MKRTIGEEIIEGLEGFANTLEADDEHPDKLTSRTIFLDLQPQVYSPSLVKKTRKLLGVSQAVFAQFLGVAAKTVSAWEQGKNNPQEVACRLMDEIRHNPPYWQGRLQEIAITKRSGRKMPVHA